MHGLRNSFWSIPRFWFWNSNYIIFHFNFRQETRGDSIRVQSDKEACNKHRIWMFNAVNSNLNNDAVLIGTKGPLIGFKALFDATFQLITTFEAVVKWNERPPFFPQDYPNSAFEWGLWTRSIMLLSAGILDILHSRGAPVSGDNFNQNDEVNIKLINRRRWKS